MTIYTNVGSGGAIVGGSALLNDPICPIDSMNQVDFTTWLITYHSQIAPPVTFTVYVAGTAQITNQISQTGQGQAFINVPIGASPFIEVICQGVPHFAAPGDVQITWRSVTGAVQYIVQQYVDSAWTTLVVQADTGAGNNYYQTAWLGDGTTNDFQIIPVDNGGYQGTPMPYDITIVCHPDVPQASYSYSSSTGQVTVTV